MELKRPVCCVANATFISRIKCRINSSHRPLSTSFLIPCCPIHLSRHKQTINHFRFQGMFQLGRIKEIIFDGVTRTVHLQISESRNMFQGGYLYLHRQRGRKTVQV